MEIRHRSRNNQILGSLNPDYKTVSAICLPDVRQRSPLLSENTWLIILLYYVGIFSVVLYCDTIRFPSPADHDDKNECRSLKFSEIKARTFVNALSNFGPKVTGSYVNEVTVIDYLKKQLGSIEKTAKLHNKLEVDVQTTSGCFPLDFKDGMTSCYRNVKNVVAKIGPKVSTNRSLLVNCHYDSVPTSPGASDDAVSCSIMLEVLFALSQHNEPLRHSVVFLFNGAEENILQAAHGFISQHPWSKEVVGFINLEACGAGGKQMLFQTDEKRTWLLEAYAESASYPQGSVLAQDIFQSGLIPSDTDYRIFKEFGGLPGLDFAFVKNGYVYHTKYDTPIFITPGAIQQAGDNLLQLIHKALHAQAMNTKNYQTGVNLAYFDFLGLFMVIYRMQLASIINIFFIMLSYLDTFMKIKLCSSGEISKGRIIALGKALAIMLASFIVSLVTNCLVAISLGFWGLTMMWYASPVLIVSLYGCPALGAIFFLHHCFKEINTDDTAANWVAEDVYFDVARLMWIFLLITMEFFQLKSSFICSAWVVFPTVIRAFNSWALCNFETKGTLRCWLFLLNHFAMQIIPLLLLLYCMWSMYTVFIPITGRIGAIINPDLLIGAFTAFIVFLATSYMLTVIQVMESSHKILIILGVAVLGSFSLAIFTPLAFPYSANPEAPSLQRYYLLHTKRTIHNKTEPSADHDSGYWVVPLDYNGPTTLEPHISGLKDLKPVNCRDELICGMPFYMPVVSILKKSFYVPSSEPKIHNHSVFQLLSQVSVEPSMYNLTFSVIGPDHMTLVFSPRAGINLFNWTLTDEKPVPNLKWQERQTYFIYYSYGEYTEPWRFSLIFKVPENFKQGQPLLDLVFVSHYLFGPSAITREFKSVLNQVPEWIHITPWSASLEMFTY